MIVRTPFSLVALLVILAATGCSSLAPRDFKATTPRFEPDTFFEGPTRSWGVIETRGGRPQSRLRAELHGRREGNGVVVTQDFTFEDGRKQRRVWTIRRIDEHRYEAEAGDVIGPAIGYAYGRAFHWKYTLQLRPGNVLSRVRMEHWMYLLDDGKTMLNRVSIRKFGIIVAQTTEYFQRMAPLSAEAAGSKAQAGHAPHADKAAEAASSPYAMATGVASHDRGDRRERIIPIKRMSGDVEILYGDPEKVGEPFVMRIRELPGTMIPVHSHPVDEHITVVEGSWFFAVGNKWDRAALKEIRTGGYAFAPKGSSMFAYCPDGAIVQVHGVGPFHINWAHGAKTLDDPGAPSAFTFAKGETVDTPRGRGVIRQGYASGEIIQYEIAGGDGSLFMANQGEMHRLPVPQ